MHTLQERKEFSSSRIETFRSKLLSSEELNQHSDLCIYTTGSYGRNEASGFSDIDLFFLHTGTDFSRISKTLIDAHIIQVCREMKFPEFSGDGEYLEIHKVENIHNELGSRKDDYHNYFTARMLLLLESKPVHNGPLHEKTIKETIHKYYIDFHEHEKNFNPVFIVNDVIRFWRTMCLNYEHNRNRRFNNEHQLSPSEIDSKKNQTHLKNLKLKFSRKLTCFSFLLAVLYSESVISEENIQQITLLTPLERLAQLSRNPRISDNIKKMEDLYLWFLNTTQVEKNTLLEWISISANRNAAFEKSREFAKLIFEIMTLPEKRENLLYFLI